MGCHFLFQGVFPIQGSNLHLLCWQVNSSPLNHVGSPHLALSIHQSPLSPLTDELINTRWWKEIKFIHATKGWTLNTWCWVKEARRKRPHGIWFYLDKMSQRRQWQPSPVFLPGESQGRRSLVGCSPWGRKESGTTERLHFQFSLQCTGDGNGNPLQCSCLENPRDSGAWWAAVYGVAQDRTWLKWLSSRVKNK